MAMTDLCSGCKQTWYKTLLNRVLMYYLKVWSGLQMTFCHKKLILPEVRVCWSSHSSFVLSSQGQVIWPQAADFPPCLCRSELSRWYGAAAAMHSLSHNFSLVWSSVSFHINSMPWFPCLAIGTSCIASMLWGEKKDFRLEEMFP